jgi:hypothetical protein
MVLSHTTSVCTYSVSLSYITALTRPFLECFGHELEGLLSICFKRDTNKER